MEVLIFIRNKFAKYGGKIWQKEAFKKKKTLEQKIQKRKIKRSLQNEKEEQTKCYS